MGRWGGRDSPYSKDGGPGSGQKGHESSSQTGKFGGKEARSLEGQKIKATGKLGRIPRGSFERK